MAVEEEKVLGAPSERDGEAVEKFKEFLRIPSISDDGPKGVYRVAVDFLKAYCESFGFACRELEYVANKPILVATWEGAEPSLPSLVLNSHYDVVPAFLDMWTTKPFEALERDGKIYARGTQDMKCVCTQYVEALGRLKRRGVALRRTVHMTFVPDEEVGGGDGAGEFTRSDDFRALNVGVALDEGLANPADAFTVFYGERAPWWLSVVAKGPTGHASRFVEGTAVEKLSRVIAQAMAYREEQRLKLVHSHSAHADAEPGCSHTRAKKLGDVLTLNLTALKAGVPGSAAHGGWALNVIPMEAEAGFDIRIPPTMPFEEVEQLLAEWTKEEGVEVKMHVRTPVHAITSIDRSKNRWWAIFEDTIQELGVTLEKEVFPAATDSRFFRALDIPCFGFSPMRLTPILLHDHDEFLERKRYVEGIAVFESLIPALANEPAFV